jgi:TonB-linked SusC/RagA family outer membrane protein
MRKMQFSRSGVRIFLAAALSSACFFYPDEGFAGNGPEKRKTTVQDRTITGTVRDATTSNPLVGATVSLKGSSTSTSTNATGGFSIVVPDNEVVLVISYVGYVTQEYLPGTATEISISLQPNSADLAQVVVVGYGTQNKRNVTGAIKSIKAEAFNKGIINAPQELLQGKVAGVNVTSVSGEPGGVLGITVRGPGGIRTGSTPLFVIDGLALDNSTTGGGDPLNAINPQDIAAIDVLKDASATAIYGARGANGVIIITTKRGKAGQPSLEFSTNVGASKLANKLPVFSAAEFKQKVTEIGGTLDDKGADTDWQDVVTRTAVTTNNNVSFSGGTDKLTYYASLGAQVQEGIIKTNQNKRYAGRFNATQKFLEDRLVIDLNLSVANTQNQRPPVSSIVGEAISNNPTYAAYGPDGNRAVYQAISNPLIYFDLDKDITNITRVIGNISPSLKIITGLTYKLNFGIDHSTGTRDIQALPNAVPFRDGRLETYNTYNRNRLIENTLTYDFKTGSHNIGLLAGHSYQKIFLQGRNTSVNKFPIGTIEPIYNPGIGQELTLANNRPGGFALINELQSYFGRINYSYDNKYVLTVNFRADGSSKFGENKKYGYFPSFSLGYNIADEAFMRNSIFSTLKLRGGWGLTGNQEIPAKLSQPLFTSSVSGTTSYPLYGSGAYPGGITYTRLANPDLQWEVSKQTNIGLDFGLFNEALTGSVDVFRKVSSNILLQIPPSDPIQPASTTYANIENMEIENKGIEIDLNYRQKTNIGLQFNIGGNITFIKNEVTNSPYTLITSGSASGSGLTSATVNGYINNQPIGTFYLLEFTGIAANGTSVYKDVDGDGIISDKDRQPLGTALPKVMYSFYGNASFKGFDLNVNFNGVSGNKIYDNTANANFYKAKLAKSVNTTAEALEEPKESINNAASVSSRYLKDGAFLRLNNLSLGYTFNTNKLGINKWVRNLRLYVTGQNLFVVTKYDGYDPEVNTDRTVDSVLSYGIDYLSYPKARTVIFGLNVTF